MDTSTSATPEPKRFHCRHIFTSGHRCGSPALKGEEFCYYHHTTRRPDPNRHQTQGRRAAFALPNPEDRSAIQSAIGQVLLRLASNDLDPRRAGLLLYGLQIASLNLPKQKEPAEPAETVEEVVQDPELGLVALPADFNQRIKREKSLEEILMEEWAKNQEQEAQIAQEPSPETAAQEPEWWQQPIPRLNAVAAPTARVPHPSQPHREGWDVRVHQPRCALRGRRSLRDVSRASQCAPAGRNQRPVPTNGRPTDTERIAQTNPARHEVPARY